MQNELITIGLVDDHTLFRNTLTLLLNRTDKCRVSFEAANGKELQEVLSKGPLPDILLLDLLMPVMGGFETLEWLYKTHPQLQVIILTMCETNLTMTKLVHLGARAILKKAVCDKELMKAIFRVKEDGYYFNDPASRNLLVAMYTQEKKKRGNQLLLSEKEWKFIKLAATDMTHKQIAVEMNISARGVNKINSGLFEKLGVQNRVVLAVEAVRNGIIDPAA